MKSLILYNNPTVPRGSPLLLPQALRLKHSSFLFIDEKHCESQSDSVANTISIRALSLTKEGVELRIFPHISAIVAAERRGLTVQVLMQIRSEFSKDWRRVAGARGGVLWHPKAWFTWKFTHVGQDEGRKANQGRGKLPTSLPFHYTPSTAKEPTANVRPMLLRLFVCCPVKPPFSSFSPSWNEVSTLWLSFRSKFLKYFIIYQRFPYWLRTGKNMSV